MKKFILWLVAISAFGLNAQNVEPSYTDSCEIREEWLYEDYNWRTAGQALDLETDFFLLVFSNSPNFCDYQASKGKLKFVPFQCLPPSTEVNDFGWVVHGLWGESREAYIADDSKGHPRFCKGDVEELTFEEMEPYLCTSPGSSLLQNEWEKHGTCDFDTPSEYFDKMLELRSLFQLPEPSKGASEAVDWMKSNNIRLANVWLHKTDHEFGVCFTTDFEIMDCPKR